MSFQTPIVIDEDGFIDLSNKRKRFQSDDYDSDFEQQERSKQSQLLPKRKRRYQKKTVPTKTSSSSHKECIIHDLTFSVSDIESDDDNNIKPKILNHLKKLPFHINHQIPYDAIPSDDENEKQKKEKVSTTEDKRVRIKAMIDKK